MCSHPRPLAAGHEGRERFFRKLLTGLRYVPRVLVTDKLGSYHAAHREFCPRSNTAGRSI